MNAAMSAAMNTNAGMGNGGTTILMTNNTPQPVYGMNQSMGPMMQPNYSQPFQPVYQQIPQPTYDPSFMQAGYALAGQPQPGPIIY